MMRKYHVRFLGGERGSNTPDLPDKEYYDALKSVHNLVKDARKVQKSILLIGEISDIYVNSFQKMLSDENYTPDELSAIAYGYTQLLQESSDVLEEMKSVGEHQTGFPCRTRNGWTLSTGRITLSGTTGIW